MDVRTRTVRQHGLANMSLCRNFAAALAMLVCIAVPTGTGLAAPAPGAPGISSNNINLGGGTYRVTASVFAEGTDGQVGTQASSGHWIQPNDNLVALPACTESSCPWVPVGTGVEGTYGPQTSCAESDGLCWVEVVSDETGECTTAPVHDRGPLFVRDNWWAKQNQREYSVPQGTPAAEYAADGVDFGYGAGISDVGHDIQNVWSYAAGIDLAGGTWQAIGLPISAGITTLTVTMLWQAGITHDQACGGGPGGEPTGGNASVDSSLNLRSQPSLSASVLEVMSGGSRVTVTGPSQNGFYPLAYGGTNGWGSGQYLTIDAGEDPGSDDGGSEPPPGGTGEMATVIDGSLNLRANPSTGASVLLVMPDGAVVELTGNSSNGFLSVSYQGQAGWAYSDYLNSEDGSGPPAPSPGTDGPAATVVDGALNLRSGPGTDYAVIVVMPGGASVILTGENSNGFSSVAYQGQAGWAYSTYLSTADDDGGPSAPPPGSGGIPASVFDGPLNLRAGPGTSYAVLLTMPDGAAVVLTGESSGDFVTVEYQGTAGWAFRAYLGEENAPPPTGNGETATVIDGSLNLRSGAGTAFAVLTVMPGGATVELTGQSEGGFLGVIYQGTSGWASATYLSTGGSIPSGGTETVVDGSLNLRASASTNASVLLVMPGGAVVTLGGDEQNGFLSVTYRGTAGWAYSAYLE